MSRDTLTILRSAFTFDRDQHPTNGKTAFCQSRIDLIDRILHQRENAAAMTDVVVEPRIVTRCPSCGSQTLFIGDGGHLTCALIGCPNPSVGRATDQLKADATEFAAVTALLARAVRMPGIADRIQMARPQKGTPADAEVV